MSRRGSPEEDGWGLQPWALKDQSTADRRGREGRPEQHVVLGNGNVIL